MEEIWYDIPNFSIYQISSFGRVRNKKRNKLRKVSIDGNGYKWVTLNRDGKYYYKFIHRMLCEIYHGEPPFEGALALHANDIKDDLSKSNLYWGTHFDNACDRRENGNSFAGKGNVNYKHGRYM